MKRFDLFGIVREDRFGNYVKHQDYLDVVYQLRAKEQDVSILENVLKTLREGGTNDHDRIMKLMEDLSYYQILSMALGLALILSLVFSMVTR